MNKDVFVDELNKIGVEISKEQIVMLDKYYKMLIEWNKKTNLTAITEEKQVYLKHFYDSLTLSLVYDFNKNISVCDVGTGAGFPGLVLKIVFPGIKLILVDSNNKKIQFLTAVVNQLGLDRVEIEHFRIEEYGKKEREKFDVVTCRAVARLNIISELCIPLLKVNGVFIAMKGNIGEEVKEIAGSLKLLTSEIEEIKKFELPIEESARSLVKIKKIEKTDQKYPRVYEKIKRNPL
jgi:16S rRNA (guanine527-N7)-methyltransferase